MFIEHVLGAIHSSKPLHPSFTFHLYVIVCNYVPWRNYFMPILLVKTEGYTKNEITYLGSLETIWKAFHHSSPPASVGGHPTDERSAVVIETANELESSATLLLASSWPSWTTSSHAQAALFLRSSSQQLLCVATTHSSLKVHLIKRTFQKPPSTPRS